MSIYSYNSFDMQLSCWVFSSVQFSSVSQLCLTISDHMNCSRLGFPVRHKLLEIIQTHAHWVSDAIKPSHSLMSSFPPAFTLSQLFSNESVICIRWLKYWTFNFSISISNEYLDWFPLGLTGLISLPSEGLSRVFSNTSTQISLWFHTYIHTWLLGKPWFWLDRPLLAR